MSLIVLFLIIDGNANTWNSCWLFTFRHWLLVILCCTAFTIQSANYDEPKRRGFLFIEISHRIRSIGAVSCAASKRYSCTFSWLPNNITFDEETRRDISSTFYFMVSWRRSKNGIAVILWNGLYYISTWNPIRNNLIGGFSHLFPCCCWYASANLIWKCSLHTKGILYSQLESKRYSWNAHTTQVEKHGNKRISIERNGQIYFSYCISTHLSSGAPLYNEFLVFHLWHVAPSHSFDERGIFGTLLLHKFTTLTVYFHLSRTGWYTSRIIAKKNKRIKFNLSALKMSIKLFNVDRQKKKSFISAANENSVFPVLDPWCATGLHIRIVWSRQTTRSQRKSNKVKNKIHIMLLK